MKTISSAELKTILENHRHWLAEDCDGWEAMCANLNDAILSYANLHYANLRDADLSYANLRDADLSYADLSYADLSYADLRFASIRGANLKGVDLSYADLSCADLRCANLSYANLSNANLSYANLSNANLSNANLSNANLRGADLKGAKNLPYIPTTCPEAGAFIGWKKAKTKRRYVIVKLEIPASAKRSSATTRKCRCDKAKVLEIYNLDGVVSEERKCYSSYDNSFIYEVGKTVKIDDFDEDRWNECSQGIHFFMNRQEAIDY